MPDPPEQTEPSPPEPDPPEPGAAGSNTPGHEPAEPDSSAPDFPTPDPVSPNPPGLDPSGLDPTGLDSAGLDSAGLDSAGFDPTGLDPTGLDPSVLDPTGFDPTGLDPSGLVGTEVDRVLDEATDLSHELGREVGILKPAATGIDDEASGASDGADPLSPGSTGEYSELPASGSADLPSSEHPERVSHEQLEAELVHVEDLIAEMTDETDYGIAEEIDAASSLVAEENAASTDDVISDGGARPGSFNDNDVVEAHAAESEAAESEAAESHVAESESADFDVAESDVAESEAVVPDNAVRPSDLVEETGDISKESLNSPQPDLTDLEAARFVSETDPIPDFTDDSPAPPEASDVSKETETAPGKPKGDSSSNPSKSSNPSISFGTHVARMRAIALRHAWLPIRERVCIPFYDRIWSPARNGLLLVAEALVTGLDKLDQVFTWVEYDFRRILAWLAAAAMIAAVSITVYSLIA